MCSKIHMIKGSVFIHEDDMKKCAKNMSRQKIKTSEEHLITVITRRRQNWINYWLKLPFQLPSFFTSNLL